MSFIWVFDCTEHVFLDISFTYNYFIWKKQLKNM